MVPAIPVITLKRVDAGKLHDFLRVREKPKLFVFLLLSYALGNNFLRSLERRYVSYIYVNWMMTDR